MWFICRQASRLFRIGTTTLLILLDYIVPVFLMVWCSALILMTNFESPRTTICISQIEKNGFKKLSTRDKELNKRTLVASLLGLFVYAVQSVCYGYEMFSAAYMQVNNYYKFRMVRKGLENPNNNFRQRTFFSTKNFCHPKNNAFRLIIRCTSISRTLLL